MKSALNFQMKNMINSPGLILVMIFDTLFAVVCFIVNCIQWIGSDVVNLPPAYCQYMSNGMNMTMVMIFSAVFPLISCAPFSDSYLLDFDNKSLSVILTRCKRKEYYFSKLTAVFCSGFIAVVYPQILNMLMCLTAFPVESTNVYTWDLWQADTYVNVISESWFLFRDLYILSPYLYFLLFLFISSVIGGLVAVIAYQISFFVHNRIFVLSALFVIINLTSTFYASKSIYLDVGSYMFGYNAGGQNYRDFVIVIAMYLLAAFIPSFFVMKRLKNNI